MIEQERGSKKHPVFHSHLDLYVFSSGRAGDACITYTVLNNDDERSVEIETKFCGQVHSRRDICKQSNNKTFQVQKMWDGEVVTSGRCYTEYGVSEL